MIEVGRSEETLDTPENRFIKFALIHWREVMARIRGALMRQSLTAPVQRGLREVEGVLDQLDALLSEEMFREVGPLTHFPAHSQVLQKREGYRDILRIYVQFEVAALLAWEGGQDVYSAGQRNVAILYEYWTFLQLARVITSLTGQTLDVEDLVDVREDGLVIGLTQGEHCITGEISRLGRTLRLELWFNRTFGSRLAGAADAPSWSRAMRPDCALRIYPGSENLAPFDEVEDVWLHFDAKYRVEEIRDLFGKDVEGEEDEAKFAGEEQEAKRRGEAKRADLLRMHAYRDAIRRSAGAYVLYPGTEPRDFKVYHEVLPGIGAFALRPTADESVEGLGRLRSFIDDVITHVASQVTQHERGRFWIREAYRNEYRVDNLVDSHIQAAPFLTRPPADTLVLLGYVKSKQHLEWIHRHRRYNLRADPNRAGSVGLASKELAADLLLLYGPGLGTDVAQLWRIAGEPELWGRSRMIASGYPKPRGESYYCLALEEIPREEWPFVVTSGEVERIRQPCADRLGRMKGAPVTLSWLEVATTNL